MRVASNRSDLYAAECSRVGVYDAPQLVVDEDIYPARIQTSSEMNLTIAMLEGFAQHHSFVRAVLIAANVEPAVQIATAAIEPLVSQVLADLFVVFRDAQRILDPGSGSCPRPSGASIAACIPAIKGLRQALLKFMTAVGPGTAMGMCLQRLLAEVLRGFGDIESNPLYAMASLLDARFKSGVFQSEEAAVQAERNLVQVCDRFERWEKNRPPVFPSGAVRQSGLPPWRATPLLAGGERPPKRPKSMFEPCDASPALQQKLGIPGDRTNRGSAGSAFGQIKSVGWPSFSGFVDSVSATKTIGSSGAKVHIEEYLSEPQREFGIDIELYWRENESRWPGLFNAAAQYLCTPASATFVPTRGHMPDGLSPTVDALSAFGALDAEVLSFVRQNSLCGVRVGRAVVNSYQY